VNTSSLTKFAQNLRRLPRVLAQRVADRGAPAISSLARGSFDAGQTPYGIPWAPGAQGQRVTLRKTGALERFLRYVAIGTKLRVALGTSYAKYQIGKRPVFPGAGGLPPGYVDALRRATREVAGEELGR